MTSLYKKDNTGKIRIWSIEETENGFLVSHGVLGGEIQEKEEDVFEGKAGRDIDEQISLMMQSKINKKLDAGYCYSKEDAEKYDFPKNILGMPKPMLAHKFDPNHKTFSSENLFYQKKFDGHRCLIVNSNGFTYAYSRNGKVIGSIHHITKDMGIPEGTILDGELYCHGESLQTISSWVRKMQPNTKKLTFCCYDIVDSSPYVERLESLRELYNKGALGNYSLVVETLPINDSGAIPSLLKEARGLDYEGLILRSGDFPYEIGKRSRGLLKVKQFEDAEFRVTNITSSKDGWAILECENYRNVTAADWNRQSKNCYFEVSCHGNVDYKTYVLENKNLFIGNVVTVEYAGLTKDGVPFHPVAKCWREYI